MREHGQAGTRETNRSKQNRGGGLITSSPGGPSGPSGPSTPLGPVSPFGPGGPGFPLGPTPGGPGGPGGPGMPSRAWRFITAWYLASNILLLLSSIATWCRRSHVSMMMARYVWRWSRRLGQHKGPEGREVCDAQTCMKNYTQKEGRKERNTHIQGHQPRCWSRHGDVEMLNGQKNTPGCRGWQSPSCQWTAPASSAQGDRPTR